MDWIGVISKGIITGLILTLSFGAGFFALVQTSISRGTNKGILIAVGAVISDALYIFMAMFATSFISEELPKYDKWIRIAALVSFIFIGIRTIIKSSKVLQTGDIGEKPNYYFISKGFLLNKLNPMILITWIGITAYLRSSLLYDLPHLIAFFVAVMASVFATQAGICYSSNKIKNYLSEQFIHRMNILIGILFIGLGLLIFFSGGSTEEGIEKAKDLLN
jgi:threonine/homoserine/homoserine lactone efflux protein